MALKTESINREVAVCDVCGEVAGNPHFVDLVKCDYCGKDLCWFCRAIVSYRTVDPLRGWQIVFAYTKVMCQAHLPKKK